jgi:hypothetical protein
VQAAMRQCWWQNSHFLSVTSVMGKIIRRTAADGWARLSQAAETRW